VKGYVSVFESIFGNGNRLKCLIRAERIQLSAYVISQDGLTTSWGEFTCISTNAWSAR